MKAVSPEPRRNSKTSRRASGLNFNLDDGMLIAELGDEGYTEATIGFYWAVLVCFTCMVGPSLVLPGIAFEYTGTSAFLAVIVSGAVVACHLLAKAELASAMPHKGGDFVYISQAWGPLLGTVLSIAIYCNVLLKSAFAALAFSYYLEPLVGTHEDETLKLIATGIMVVVYVLAFCGLDGTQGVGTYVNGLAAIFLLVLACIGMGNVKSEHFDESHFFTEGSSGFVETVALVIMTFTGNSKICSMADEIKDASTTLPYAMCVSLILCVIFFATGTLSMIATAKLDESHHEFAPWYYLSEEIGSSSFGYFVSVICLIMLVDIIMTEISPSKKLAFAMNENGLLPHAFTYGSCLSDQPYLTLIFTCGLTIIAIWSFDLKNIVLLASAFKLFVFIFENLSVLVYRYSDQINFIQSFESPGYPYLHIMNIAFQITLLCFLEGAGTQALITMCTCGILLYGNYGKANANFLGIMQLEHYAGLIPDSYRLERKYLKKLKEVQDNPLHLYNKDLAQRLQTTNPKENYDKTFIYNASESRDKNRGSLVGIIPDVNIGKRMYVHRILLTGASGEYKMNALESLAALLTEKGFDAYCLPNVSSVFQNLGVVLPKNDDSCTTMKYEFVDSALKTQIHFERSMTKIAETTSKPSALLIDDGTLENKALFAEIFEEVLQYSIFDEEYLLKRYDLVLHFVAPTLEDESNVDALNLDLAIQEAYSKHPSQIIVPSKETDEESFTIAAEAVMSKLNERNDSNLTLTHEELGNIMGKAKSDRRYSQNLDLSSLTEKKRSSIGLHPAHVPGSGERRLSLKRASLDLGATKMFLGEKGLTFDDDDDGDDEQDVYEWEKDEADQQNEI